MHWKQINEHVQVWLREVSRQLLLGKKQELQVATKSERTDLVTNIDKQVEKYLVAKIRATFPTSKILGEEGTKDKDLASSQGLLWIIDPLDGTMNYVKQRDCFASMIAVYENGHEKLGYILDVTAQKLYWGGPECGIFCNDERLPKVADLSLAQGLIDVSGRMLMNNYHNVCKMAQTSMGIRVYGSAGISFIHVLTGKTVAYFSHLHPWDYAAGKILAHAQGLSVKGIDDSKFDMLSSDDVLVATKNAEEDILKLLG